MYVIKKFYKWEVVAIYYCRTEEKARHILNLIIAEDFIKNNHQGISVKAIYREEVSVGGRVYYDISR